MPISKKIVFSLSLLFLLVLSFIGFRLYKIKNYPINSFIKDISNYHDKNKRTKYLWDAFPQYDYAYFKNQNILEISNRKQLKVRDLLKNKKYIFINFWFKGCGACEEEMPEIDNFYKKYRNKIQFIIISND